MQREADTTEATLGGFLGDDRVVAEILDTAAAEFLRYRGSQESLLSGLDPDVTIDDVLLFPLLVVRCHVLCQELLVRLPEEFMFRFEQGALHADSLQFDIRHFSDVPGGDDVPGRDIFAETGHAEVRGPTSLPPTVEPVAIPVDDPNDHDS